jgi:hypothetical protein
MISRPTTGNIAKGSEITMLMGWLSTIHNGWEIETIKKTIDWCMGKEHMVHILNWILLSPKNEWNLVFVKTRKKLEIIMLSKINHQEKNTSTEWSHSYGKSKKVSTIEAEDRMSVTGAWGELREVGKRKVNE